MLEVLAKKDSYWRSIAFNICKDRMLADDLVSEMYIRLMDCKKEINDFYVIVTIKNIFLQEIKTKNTVSIEKFYTQYILIWGLAAIPIVATYLIQTNIQLINKVSPIIAKIFTPLVFINLIIF